MGNGSADASICRNRFAKVMQADAVDIAIPPELAPLTQPLPPDLDSQRRIEQIGLEPPEVIECDPGLATCATALLRNIQFTESAD